MTMQGYNIPRVSSPHSVHMFPKNIREMKRKNTLKNKLTKLRHMFMNIKSLRCFTIYVSFLIDFMITNKEKVGEKLKVGSLIVALFYNNKSMQFNNKEFLFFKEQM